MKKKRPVIKEPSAEERQLDFANRLAELEAELRGSAANASATVAIVMVSDVKAERVRGEEVIQFTHKGKVFSAGHTDSIFAGTNDTRGVRKIHLYDEGDAVVLGISGDIEMHPFGAHFRLRTVKTFVPGEWESAFLTITTSLRAYRADHKEALRERRAAALRKKQ